MIDVTALILTFNEEQNIGRTLGALKFIERVLIIDSFSTDETIRVAHLAHPSVRVETRAFDSFAGQCNFGLAQITTEWVLSIDADYVLTPELGREIAALNPGFDTGGYSAQFRYCIFGYALRDTVYPARTILYRRALARYQDEGHGHRVIVDGKIDNLMGKVDHDDRKPLSHWIRSQDRYAAIEAKHLLNAQRNALKLQDRIRLRIYFAPILMFGYLLLARGLICDGWRGWYYISQRVIAELLLSIRLLEEKKHLKEMAS